MKKKNTYKAVGKRGFFDNEFTRQQISAIGNPLEGLDKVIDFEMFREQLEAKMLNHTKMTNVGPRPYDVVLMFKILILQRFYGLGDKQIEYQILDRTSFKQFLGLDTGDKVPDEKTVWAFREQLTKSGLVETIFADFTAFLDAKGLIVNEGKMIDASFTIAPRQRNTREENAQIKAGKGDKLWAEEPNKKRHKDIDARWTKKNNEAFYGYKNHAKVDTKSKFIDGYVVTSASVHDSKPITTLLTKNDEGQTLHADSAYTGKECDKAIRNSRMKNRVTKKGYKNKPLTNRQIKANHIKSKTRSRVEHVFGFMEQSMNGLCLRSVGILRATGIIGLINLTYNLFRYEQIIRLKLLEVK